MFGTSPTTICFNLSKKLFFPFAKAIANGNN
jgi:hypothetical protein